jgi:inositol phosphorylceramide mannosyltransferase catalytic subunit
MPTGISNDALGAVPRHPFYKLVTENLERYNRNWGSGYITVMYSTGPLFFSALWVQYLRELGGSTNATDRVKVLVREGDEGDSYGFFKNVQGGSWHGKDVELIFWMGKHWVLVTLFGFIVGFGVTGLIWWVGRVVGSCWKGRRVDEKRGRYRLTP